MQCNVASCICICFSKCIVVVIVCRIGSGSGSYSCPSIYLSVCLSVGLSDCLSVCLSVSLSLCLCVCLSRCLSLCLSVSVSVCLCACLSLCLSVSVFVSVSVCLCLSVRLFVHPSVCLSVCLSASNEPILPDFLNFWPWQHQKRSNSARLPQFSKLATAKTKPFCETSFKYRKLSAELTASSQRILRFCHEKDMPSHTKCCTCHAKSSQQTWRSDAPKCNPSQDISALTSEHLWWICLLYCACHVNFIFPDPCPTLAIVLGNATKPARSAHLWEHAESLAPATQNEIWTPKNAPNPSIFNTFDCETCFAPQRRALFSTSTSKSGPRLVCFVHLGFQMCFAPQRRALFRHLNFQKCSEREVFLAFSLANVLRATMACTFSTSQLPRVVRTSCALYMMTSKCASRHNAVQLVISHLNHMAPHPPHPPL